MLPRWSSKKTISSTGIPESRESSRKWPLRKAGSGYGSVGWEGVLVRVKAREEDEEDEEVEEVEEQDKEKKKMKKKMKKKR